MSRDMTMIVQQLVNGITQGGLYALLAISYALVYGVMNLVNFSTGSIYMLGAIGGWAVCNFLTENFFLSIAVGFVIGFVAAFVLEKLAFKSIRGISRISSLICTIGFSQLINELMALIFGKATKGMPAFFATKAFTVVGVTISWLQLVLMFTVIVILLSLQILIYKTRMGLAIRTVSMDTTTAGLMGIDVDKTISIAFSLAGSCAAIAGVAGSIYYRSVSAYMGWAPGIKAFSAAVFGGLTSMPGAILGGYLMGIIENFGVQLFSTGYRDVISFVVMIVFLLVRPQGLLGKKKITKV